MTPYKERKERDKIRRRFTAETGLSYTHKDAFRAWLDADELDDAEAARAHRIDMARRFSAGLRSDPPNHDI